MLFFSKTANLRNNCKNVRLCDNARLAAAVVVVVVVVVAAFFDVFKISEFMLLPLLLLCFLCLAWRTCSTLVKILTWTGEFAKQPFHTRWRWRWGGREEKNLAARKLLLCRWLAEIRVRKTNLMKCNFLEETVWSCCIVGEGKVVTNYWP